MGHMGIGSAQGYYLMGLTPFDPIWPIFWGFGGSINWTPNSWNLCWILTFCWFFWSLQTPKIWVRWSQIGSEPLVHTPGPTPYPSNPYLTPTGLSEPIIAEIAVQFGAIFGVSFWSLQTPILWVRWVQMGSDPSVYTPWPAPYPSDPFLSDFWLATGLWSYLIFWNLAIFDRVRNNWKKGLRIIPSSFLGSDGPNW